MSEAKAILQSIEEVRISLLTEVEALRAEMNNRFDHVDAELAKINDVTGYEGKARNMKILDDKEEA